MAKVVIHTPMTLDGLIARPNDEIDWELKFGADEMVKEIKTEISAVVMGNRGSINGMFRQEHQGRFLFCALVV
jgi:riboflavin biosynthesis pyrimidine reductase